MNQTDQTTQPVPSAVFGEGEEQHESYFQLVWQRFRKSKPAIIGGLMVLMLAILAIFSDFFSPTDPLKLNMAGSFTPPQRLHFIDADGRFHLRPFTYLQVIELDPVTFVPMWSEDTSQRYHLKFFVQSWEWKVLGLTPTRYHLFGIEEGGTVYLLGTDKFGRDLWSRACRAGRISLAMSLFGTFISVAAGSVLGVVSGYYGGAIDTLLQRFVEFVNSFPQLPMWMALSAVIPPTWPPLSA